MTLMSHQSARRERQGDTDDDGASATSWFPAGAALGAAGLATASTAITCMAISEQSSDPPAAMQEAVAAHTRQHSARWGTQVAHTYRLRTATG